MSLVSNKKLSEGIREYFRTLTDNEQIIELAISIHEQMSNGNSAISNVECINHEFVSTDGASGYIVQHNGRTGFRRFFNDEMFIKREFENSLSSIVDINRVQNTLSELGVSASQTDDVDLQWQAVIAFLFHSRFVLSGGPGTGKTTTIVRMILLYMSLFPEHSIALAAPTGKAANRMLSGIRQSIHDNSYDLDVSLLPDEAFTIHRLLGYSNQNNDFHISGDNKLKYDLVFVDEASMLDSGMMSALLSSLKDNAKLVLLGDKDQLPSIDVGNVFADLCGIVEGKDIVLCDLLNSALAGMRPDVQCVPQYIELTKNYRFSDSSVIMELCKNVNSGNYQGVVECSGRDGFTWINTQSPVADRDYLTQWYKNNGSASQIILAATNNGERSVSEMNRLSTLILNEGRIKSDGVPVMVTRNDYTLGLYNGDIGSMRYSGGRWYVDFNDKITVMLDAISDYELAYAISIHKSQGSEYDHVLISMPDNVDDDFISSQLLYTALSRAKKSITLIASESVVRRVVECDRQRVTFLS